MKELTLDEKTKLYAKLKFFIGDNINFLLKDKSFFLHHKRVLLVPNNLIKYMSSIPKDNIVYAGTVIGKFTKSEKFRICVSGIRVLSQYAINKVWIKNSAEMNFLYGNNALKSHIYRLSENIPINSGVFVYNQADVCLGYGICAVKPEKYPEAKGYQLTVIRQGDNGEYLRSEKDIA
ncbi:ribosome biogenesis protein NIP7 [Vairimorpha necatrix]|uniref:60S ribosome subunit biogenesis protein NIP7 n=1 Tax=Vairimorpha necatrix TaxID=6039 RepID=A0AAX4JDS2_9MICR